LTLEDGIDTFPEKSVKDYHSTLRNIPEERRSHQYRGGTLKSRIKWEVMTGQMQLIYSNNPRAQ
jgi:hypothetical protein